MILILDTQFRPFSIICHHHFVTINGGILSRLYFKEEVSEKENNKRKGETLFRMLAVYVLWLTQGEV